MTDTLKKQPVANVARHLLFAVASPIVAKLGPKAVQSLELAYFTPDTNKQEHEAGKHAVEYSFVYKAMRPTCRLANADVDALSLDLTKTLTQTVTTLAEGGTSI